MSTLPWKTKNRGNLNLLFFTKGRKTGKIWYYDLSSVKVGKKTPLTLAHFGFDPNGAVLADAHLPAILTADWQADEANAGQPFPSYARLLQARGKPEGDSRYSWTVDFAARRAKARAERQPLLDEAAQIKAARELETKAADIDAAVFDLKAVNPTAVVETDTRAPQQIISQIEAQGRIVSEALARLAALLAAGD